MKLNIDMVEKRIMRFGAFGQVPFSSKESRLTGAQWLNQSKGLVFRFIPDLSTIRMANVIGR